MAVILCFILYFIELPTPQWIKVKDVTSSSASVEWSPVEGASKYKVQMVDDSTNEEVYLVSRSF